MTSNRRDLLSIIRSNESEWKLCRPLCHQPERRDLQFRGPLLEMFFDTPAAMPGREAKRPENLRPATPPNAQTQTRLAFTLVANPTFSSIHIPR
jgi:hypothetical protein